MLRRVTRQIIVQFTGEISLVQLHFSVCHSSFCFAVPELSEDRPNDKSNHKFTHTQKPRTYVLTDSGELFELLIN